MENDYAVIVGLQNYPGLDDPVNGRAPLSGPENDANDFKDWVASPDGGDVPEQNISLILSSRYDAVEKDNLSQAKPAELEVAGAFDKLRFLSLKNSNAGLGSRIGRRLYIFMSGHGIAPTQFGNKTEKECSLLMANVDPTNITAPRYNIPGTYTATWFCENECFEEVFLFMDCCRDMKIVASPNWFLPVKGNADNAKRFYAFATKWSRRSREKIIDGKMQGIFTKTLLLALNGGCAVPDPLNPMQGVITGESLKNYLYENMKKFIDTEFIDNTEVQQPDIDYFPKINEGSDILVKATTLPTFPIIIDITSDASGEFKILDNNFSTIKTGVIENPPQKFYFKLPRGKFLLEGTVNATVKSFQLEVVGIESPGNEAIFSL